MFYCEECRIKNMWPEAFSRSHGKCECCDTVTRCHDRPSSSLPPVRRTPAEPAPASTGRDALSYGPVHVVADLVRNLLTLDQSAPIYSAFHVDHQGQRRCRTRGVMTSWERVIDGKWVDPARTDVPYAVIVWAKPEQDEAAPVAARELDVEAERREPPTLPRYLLDMIGEYGHARTDSVGQLEVQHRWETLIGGIKRYASDFASTAQGTQAESAPVSTEQAGDAWISVEDRLPEKECLAAYSTPNGKVRLIRAKYARKFQIEAEDDDCETEYNEDDDTFYIKEGWLECIDNWGEYSSCYVVEGIVTHWMPLPAAPSPNNSPVGADKEPK